MGEKFNFGAGLVPAHRHGNGGGWVADSAEVAESAFVGPDARVYGSAWVSGSARVYDSARVFGSARVSGNARVDRASHVLTVDPIGSESQTMTVTPHKDGFDADPVCIVGCWVGRLSEVVAEAKRRGCTDAQVAEYEAAVALASLRQTRWLEVS